MRGSVYNKYVKELECEILIIGSGPAGVSAAIYSKRYGRDVLVVDELGIAGGQLQYIGELENYPGNPHITGSELIDNFNTQLEDLNVNILSDKIHKINKENNLFIVEGNNYKITSKSIIYCGGVNHRHLNVEGEKEYLGKGVSYCAVCDTYFFKDKEVVVVGGGDSALSEALHLANVCKKVFIVHRRNEFRAQMYLQEKTFNTNNIHYVLGRNVSKIVGDGNKVTSVKLDDGSKLNVDAVFVSIGMIPNVDVVKDYVSLDDNGFIETDESMRTVCRGLFVAGDCRSKKLRQIVTAVNDGAIAATTADDYIKTFF